MFGSIWVKIIQHKYTYELTEYIMLIVIFRWREKNNVLIDSSIKVMNSFDMEYSRSKLEERSCFWIYPKISNVLLKNFMTSEHFFYDFEYLIIWKAILILNLVVRCYELNIPTHKLKNKLVNCQIFEIKPIISVSCNIWKYVNHWSSIKSYVNSS